MNCDCVRTFPAAPSPLGLGIGRSRPPPCAADQCIETALCLERMLNRGGLALTFGCGVPRHGDVAAHAWSIGKATFAGGEAAATLRA